MATYYEALLKEAGLGGRWTWRVPRTLSSRRRRGVADAYARLGGLLIVDAKATPNNHSRRTSAAQQKYCSCPPIGERRPDSPILDGCTNAGWVSQDPVRAVRLYEQSARSGDTMGASRMGIHYLNGTGGLRAIRSRGLPVFRTGRPGRVSPCASGARELLFSRRRQAAGSCCRVPVVSESCGGRSRPRAGDCRRAVRHRQRRRAQ